MHKENLKLQKLINYLICEPNVDLSYTVIEAYYITNKNASYQRLKKFNLHEGKHSEKGAAKIEMYVPENPRKKCTGFSYIGPKQHNMIPKDIKEGKTTDDFKNMLKGWIWENIH